MPDILAILSEAISVSSLVALGQVILIDLVLAGDNAIVIGLAAAGLPKEQRTRAILIGIAAATVLRIFFAAITTQLLAIVGLLLAVPLAAAIGVLVRFALGRYLNSPLYTGGGKKTRKA